MTEEKEQRRRLDEVLARLNKKYNPEGRKSTLREGEFQVVFFPKKDAFQKPKSE